MRPPREAAAGACAREQVVRALTHAAEGAARRLGMDDLGEYERQASSASRPALETRCGSIDASDPSSPPRRGVRPASASGHRGNRAQPVRAAESPPAQPAAGRCAWDACGGAELEGKLEHLTLIDVRWLAAHAAAKRVTLPAWQALPLRFAPARSPRSVCSTSATAGSTSETRGSSKVLNNFIADIS